MKQKIYNSWNELYKDRYSEIEDSFEASEEGAINRLSEICAMYKHTDCVLFKFKSVSDVISEWNIVRKKTSVRIVELLCEGYSTKRICETLDITMHFFDVGLIKCFSCTPNQNKAFPVYKDDIYRNIVKLLKYEHERIVLEQNFRKSLKKFDD